MSKLTEANKDLFGTENPTDVKRLFESTSDTKSFFETVVNKAINQTKEDYKSRKLKPNYRNYDFRDWAIDYAVAGRLMTNILWFVLQDAFGVTDENVFKQLYQILHEPSDLIIGIGDIRPGNRKFKEDFDYSSIDFESYESLWNSLVDYAASTVSGSTDENSIKRLIEKIRTKAVTKPMSEKIYIYYGTEENGYEIQKYETKNLIKDLGDILADTDLSKREIMDLINEFTENINENGEYFTSTYNSHGYDIFIGVAKKSQTKTLTDILKSLRKQFIETGY